MRQANATPTLRDVAREAGVSAMAASVVLNGATSSTRVSPAARERIQEAAARLNYRRNAVAHGLSRRRMDTLGVVAAVDGGEPNLYFLAVLNGVLEAAAERGQNVTVFSVREWHEDEPKILASCDGRVDGMILIAPQLSPALARALQRCTPFVAVHGSDVPDGECNLDVDDEAGAHLVVQHLLAHGHRRIAHLSAGPNLLGARKRLAGYCRALEEAGIAFDDALVVPGAFSVDSGRRGMEELLARCCAQRDAPPPTAVFCASDAIAYGAIEALSGRNMGVPNDLSVAGFDDTLMARMTTPPLTTVRQPLRHMGRCAVEHLLARIEPGARAAGSASPPPESCLFSVELVCRGSVGPPPATG